MNCRNMQCRLVDHLDCDLRPSAQRELRAHLAECPTCRAEHESLRQLDAICGEFLVAPAPDYTFDDLLRRMAAVDPLDEIVAFLPRLRLNAGVPRFAAAVVLLLLAGGISLLLRQGRSIYTAQRDVLARHIGEVEARIDNALDPAAPDPEDPRRNANA